MNEVEPKVRIVSNEELEAMWLQELEMVKREARKAGKTVHCSADLEVFFKDASKEGREAATRGGWDNIPAAEWRCNS